MDQQQTVVGARLVTPWPLGNCSIAESWAVMHPYGHRLTLIGWSRSTDNRFWNGLPVDIESVRELSQYPVKGSPIGTLHCHQSQSRAHGWLFGSI